MPSEPRFASYGVVQDYLFSLKAQGARFGIDRMRGLVEALGHPERRVPCIHVAGTNGKGSTVAMLQALLARTGARVGMYTSPHLVRLGERVRVNGRSLSNDEIVAYVNELAPVADALGERDADDRPSFFEFMTAMAFLQFARRQCDWSLIEVGMGGRLDATNVVEPEVSVITSIGLDHCEFLGDTLAKIAAEKAGIIKPGRPVVMGRMPAEAEAVIRAVAMERGCRLWSVREAFGDDLENCPETNLVGDHQRWNAASAVLTLQVLRDRIHLTDTEVKEALQRVVWPGRWQRIEQPGWTLVLDASHNPEGAEVLANLLGRLAQEGRPLRVVTGVLGAARAQPLLATVAAHASEIHLVMPAQARACSREELRSLLPTTYRGKVFDASVSELFPGPGQCRLAAPGAIVLVTGSIYLLGEVLGQWDPSLGEGEGRLQDF